MPARPTCRPTARPGQRMRSEAEQTSNSHALLRPAPINGTIAFPVRAQDDSLTRCCVRAARGRASGARGAHGAGSHCRGRRATGDGAAVNDAFEGGCDNGHAPICAVCLQPVDVPELWPGCKHSFHARCLSEARLYPSGLRCPLCRRSHGEATEGPQGAPTQPDKRGGQPLDFPAGVGDEGPEPPAWFCHVQDIPGGPGAQARSRAQPVFPPPSCARCALADILGPEALLGDRAAMRDAWTDTECVGASAAVRAAVATDGPVLAVDIRATDAQALADHTDRAGRAVQVSLICAVRFGPTDGMGLATLVTHAASRPTHGRNRKVDTCDPRLGPGYARSRRPPRVRGVPRRTMDPPLADVRGVAQPAALWVAASGASAKVVRGTIFCGNNGPRPARGTRGDSERGPCPSIARPSAAGRVGRGARSA